MNSSDLAETILMCVAAVCVTALIGGCMMQETAEKANERELAKEAMAKGYEQVDGGFGKEPLWKKTATPEPAK